MRFEQTVRLSAPREAVWRILADTDRLNREMGLPLIRFDFRPGMAGGTEAWATVRYAGLTLRYREHPFEWLRPSYYHVRRTFLGGPIREIWGGTELEPDGDGTRVKVFAEVVPAGAFGKPFCAAAGAKSIADFVSACHRFEAYFTGHSETLCPRHAGRPPVDRPRLERALAELERAGADPALARRLADHLAKAPPEDTTLMRPFELADAWGVPRLPVLETCLMAARSGMLELRWRVLCPYCRSGPPGARRLQELEATVHCESCNIRYDAAFDRSVEVCFSVAPSIRPVRHTLYCIGGPQLSPHTVGQWILEPGERTEICAPQLSWRYELTSLQIETPVPLELDDADAGSLRMHVCACPGGRRLLVERDRAVQDGRWTLENGSDQRIILRLEAPEWRADSATAAMVTSLARFRDLFSSEVLSPGVEMAVQQVCILFSDLKGSTAMYRSLGDAASYRTVREHFAAMRRTIAAHDGAVVKTAGDAVMASFHDPADALAAAVDIQRESRAEPDGLVVKLGLHWGPALAVNANDTLDYFGQTVNLAARLQHESEGGDIVLATEVARDPRVAALLTSGAVTAELLERSIRGLEERIPILRLRVTV